MIDCSTVREESLNHLIKILKEDSLLLNERGTPYKRSRVSIDTDESSDQPFLRRSKRLRMSEDEPEDMLQNGSRTIAKMGDKRQEETAKFLETLCTEINMAAKEVL
jgi:hypothetical protein